MTRRRDRIKRRTQTEVRRMWELAKKTWVSVRSPYDDDKIRKNETDKDSESEEQ